MQIDWNLLLEYVTVLAAPTATVIGAVLVSSLGLRTFRRQKTLERRLDWYHRMHRLLGETGNAFGLAALAAKHGDEKRAQEWTERYGKMATELGHLSSDCWMFASQESFTAVQLMTAQLPAILQRAEGGMTEALADELNQVFHVAAIALAADLRTQLGISQVKALTPEEVQKRIGPAA